MSGSNSLTASSLSRSRSLLYFPSDLSLFLCAAELLLFYQAALPKATSIFSLGIRLKSELNPGFCTRFSVCFEPDFGSLSCP